MKLLTQSSVQTKIFSQDISLMHTSDQHQGKKEVLVRNLQDKEEYYKAEIKEVRKEYIKDEFTSVIIDYD